MGGKLIDFGKEEEVEVRSLIGELLEFVDEVVDDLGSRDAIRYVETMLERGPGAERQLAVWRRTQDLKAVVDYVVEETEHGLGLDGTGDAAQKATGGRA
jgi:carboxylate-amine ligase